MMEVATKKTVVVLGASGRQGGSTAQHLLSTKKYQVRAVSRNATNPKLAELKALGADVVEASFDKPESLSAAFSGAHIIFGNTNFANTLSVVAERQQGINIANAAATVETLEHFVWSGAWDVETLSSGKYNNVIHMKAKAEVAKYIKEQIPQLAAKTTEVFVPPYFENWNLMPGLYGPVVADNKLELSLPITGETSWPCVAVREIGKVMLAIIENPDKMRGHSVSGATQTLGFGPMLKQWGEEHGVAIKYIKIAPEVFESRNISNYAHKFGGEDTATIFIRAASEQMQFMQDVSVGRLQLQDLLNLQAIPDDAATYTTWKQFAAGSCDK